ncbi:MAG: branched-chain amino acid transaminase [Gemmatimonadaceae bacterium]|nr:branched-chain amino acid transaminase [Gemmatimonadaceae bacterium]
MAVQSGRTAKIWRDGSIVDWEDATIHVMSHVVHYGSAVFEGMRSYETPTGGGVFRLREHMRRFHNSAKIYELPLRWSVDELCQATIDTLVANGIAQCYIRPIIMRTGEQMGIHGHGSPTETFIICWNWGRGRLPGTGPAGGSNVCVSSWRRPAPDTFPTMAKAGGNYLNAQLAKSEAVRNGYDEAIMLDIAGNVAEGSGQNLFLVRDGVLYTSPIASGILEGITRDAVMRLAHDAGLAVREMEIPREMLYVADEAFFCGTAVEITPISHIDKFVVGSGKPGPVTLQVQERFMAIATGRAPDTHGWLTHVPVPVAAGSR